ncbi:MAG: shikimate dehydrogenase [Chloroflexi bacterium]|nr:shikimate dehydrogenase [Chloroflexota bacterium]
MTLAVGILGYPIKHSISPVFQQAAFDALGIDARYEAWEVPPDKLAEAVARLRRPECLGANVTIPHKEAVTPMLDQAMPHVQRIGAVNTIVNQRGKLAGYNTDVEGFLRALREDGGFDPKGKTALVLGAGGSARAVCFGLAEAGVEALFLVNRTLARAQALAQEMKPLVRHVIALPWTEEWPGAYDLLVNCTSLGMAHGADEGRSPAEGRTLPRDALVYDLVYRPAVTPLLAQAERAGCRILGGLPMLVYQGAASFTLWTGQPAPLPVMFAAARKALARPV